MAISEDDYIRNIKNCQWAGKISMHAKRHCNTVRAWGETRAPGRRDSRRIGPATSIGHFLNHLLGETWKICQFTKNINSHYFNS